LTELKWDLLFEMSGELEGAFDVGATPHGKRRIITARGGTFGGPRLRGKLMPGTTDWQLIRPDGTLEIDARLTLLTDDGQFIYMHYTGIRTGSPDVLQRLANGEAVEPSEYYFRTSPFFEAGTGRYDWLNRIVTVGIGRRTATAVIYIVYTLL